MRTKNKQNVAKWQLGGHPYSIPMMATVSAVPLIWANLFGRIANTTQKNKKKRISHTQTQEETFRETVACDFVQHHDDNVHGAFTTIMMIFRHCTSQIHSHSPEHDYAILTICIENIGVNRKNYDKRMFEDMLPQDHQQNL